jgi:hypothetical protein
MAKGVGEEEVEGGFFSAHGAHWVILIVSFKFMFFPF